MALQKDLMSSGKTAFWVVLTVLALNFLLGFIGMTPTGLFSIAGTSAITEGLGQQTIAALEGIVRIDFTSIIYIFISATLILFVGTLLVDNIKALPQGKTPTTQLALRLLYGTAVFYLLLIGFKMPALQTAVGLGIYYVVVAFTLGIVQKNVQRLV